MQNTSKILMVFLLALLSTVPHAAQKSNKVGFIKVQSVVKAVPGNQGYLALRKTFSGQLDARKKTLQSLSNKYNLSKTKANRDAFVKAQQDYQQLEAKQLKQLNAKFKPLKVKIDGAIAKVAKANGYSVILDRDIAAQSSLVVYGTTKLDLTQAVLAELKK